MMQEVTCRVRQGVQIGEDVEIAIVSVEPGLIQLSICAPPGLRITRIDPVPLPVGASEIHLRGLERMMDWPQETQCQQEEERVGAVN